MPVLDSANTLVADGRLYYRGQDAMELALTRSLEEIAGLIWLDTLEGVPPELFAGPGQRQLQSFIFDHPVSVEDVMIEKPQPFPCTKR